MKIAQLKALAKRGESELLEFKSSTSNISAGLQTVCAFLNSYHGGTVIFGVKDDGKVVGQEVTDATRKTIANEINKIEPHTKIDVQICTSGSGATGSRFVGKSRRSSPLYL